jgi:hypothetical protein
VDLRAFNLDQRSLYPVTLVLTMLSVSRSTFYALVASGDLELVKLGKRSLVTAPASFLARLADREFADRKFRPRPPRSIPAIDANVPEGPPK